MVYGFIQKSLVMGKNWQRITQNVPKWCSQPEVTGDDGQKLASITQNVQKWHSKPEVTGDGQKLAAHNAKCAEMAQLWP